MSADESRMSLKSAGFYEQIYFFGPPARRSAFMCCAVFSFIPVYPLKKQNFTCTRMAIWVLFSYITALYGVMYEKGVTGMEEDDNEFYR